MSGTMRSNSDMIKTGLSVQAMSAVLYTIFSAWVGFDYIRGGGPAGAAAAGHPRGVAAGRGSRDSGTSAPRRALKQYNSKTGFFAR